MPPLTITQKRIVLVGTAALVIYGVGVVHGRNAAVKLIGKKLDDEALRYLAAIDIVKNKPKPKE